jgi:protein-S-isoprenylcysteine O-methyltransferase Ste14
MVVGGALRLWSVSFMGRSARTRGDKAKRLLTSGPFAVCRNPIYLGNIVASCGFLVLCEILWYVPLYLALSLAFYSPIVRYEEYLLSDKYPGRYPAYRRATPRWIPLPSRKALTRPIYGIREILYREKNFLRAMAGGLLFALLKEGVSSALL